MNIDPGQSDDWRHHDLNALQRAAEAHPPPPLFEPGTDPGSSATHEPPIYTVLSFRVRHPGGGKTYDYAALRAGDGKWYVTGGETKQGVSWAAMVAAVRPRLIGPITVLGPIRSVFL